MKMKILTRLDNATRGLDAANEFLLEECGKQISLNELSNVVLAYQHGHDGLTVMARERGVSSAAMTGAMDSMEYKGLAERVRDADRRKILVNLTERGMEVLRKASLASV